jgi:hypothetical protein
MPQHRVLLWETIGAGRPSIRICGTALSEPELWLQFPGLLDMLTVSRSLPFARPEFGSWTVAS